MTVVTLRTAVFAQQPPARGSQCPLAGDGAWRISLDRWHPGAMAAALCI